MICRGRKAFAPMTTVPKERVFCGINSVGGLEAPMSEMNSSGVPESEEISAAEMRVVAVEVLCGVKTMVSVQLVPGRSVAQVLEAVKSVEVAIDRIWIVVVPVFDSVTVCGVEALPAMVVAKVSELCDRVKAASGAAFEGAAT